MVSANSSGTFTASWFKYPTPLKEVLPIEFNLIGDSNTKVKKVAIFSNTNICIHLVPSVANDLHK